jgi:succinate dehydrogenase / fumarate reductase cytochrome b subunit
MATDNRPLSPHLQVYRFQLTSILSITHRATGVFLAIGTLLLSYWLTSAAYGPQAFAYAQDLIGSIPGQLLLFGWSWSLFYHFCNGIRHLFWDAGYGFDIPTLYKSGWTVVIASVVLTLLTWIIA